MAENNVNKQILNVIWDLKYAPTTFDFVNYLAIVECWRKHNGYEKIHFYFDFRFIRVLTPREKAMSQAERLRRIFNIQVPLVNLLPRVTKVLYATRADDEFDLPVDNIFPPDYPRDFVPKEYWSFPIYPKILNKFQEKGINIQCFKPPISSIDLVKRKYKDNKYITITLRKSDFFEVRDSDFEVWYKAFLYAKFKGIQVVVIPDQDDVFRNEVYKQYEWLSSIDVVASIDVCYRTALYSNAMHNFGISNGPYGIVLYLKCDFTFFVIINEEINATKKVYVEQSFKIQEGQSPSWFLDEQAFIWETPTIEIIKPIIDRVFEKYWLTPPPVSD